MNLSEKTDETTVNRKPSSARDMTSGNIILLLSSFSVPLILGNLFQMMYNTVDSLVVGNFVGKEALAAVGSTTVIINMLVFFFNGVSIGAGVVISRCFGARDRAGLHDAVETTLFVTLVCSVLFTIIGVCMVNPMLRVMSTPEDVMESSSTYLKIYFGGISGLLLYNMGSGILRAVGDTKRPLYFLILTSVLNMLLDLFFVIVFRMGIAGVAYATVLAQFVSAFLILYILQTTTDIYYFRWKDLKCDLRIVGQILKIGLPTGIQAVLTSFSNVFVQSYVNHFESACMAGWGCYNKLDMFIMLPMQSVSQAATTFVGQNIGAKKPERVHQGTIQSLLLVESITFVIASLLFVFARSAVGMFSPDREVVQYGVLFLRTNVFFLLFNCINHTLAGALRGRGDSTGPMIIMLSCFVVLRQIYLYLVTHFVANVPQLVGFGYPVGWMACSVVEVLYYFIRWGRDREEALENRH